MIAAEAHLKVTGQGTFFLRARACQDSSEDSFTEIEVYQLPKFQFPKCFDQFYIWITSSLQAYLKNLCDKLVKL